MKAAFVVFVIFLVSTKASIAKLPTNSKENVKAVFYEGKEFSIDILNQLELQLSKVSQQLKESQQSKDRLDSALKVDDALFDNEDTNLSTPEQPIDYEQLITEIMNESNQLSTESLQQLELQYQKDNDNSFNEIDEILQDIEVKSKGLRGIVCTIIQVVHVKFVFKQYLINVNHCDDIANMEFKQIGNDIKVAMTQIVYDGRSLINKKKECSGKHGIWQDLCHVIFIKDLIDYKNNTKHSIKIILGTGHRVRDVSLKAISCTKNATRNAVNDIKVVKNKIDACWSKN